MSSPSSSTLMTPEVLGETVTLYVGPKRKKYLVHKKILCEQSKFFNAGFKTDFKEAAEGEMYLPDDDPITVANLIEYLYRGKLPISCKLRFRLYYLAEKICMSSLMDRLMDAIFEAQKAWKFRGFQSTAIESIYANTHHNSKLRLYNAATIAFRIHCDKEDAKWMQKYLALGAHVQTFSKTYLQCWRHMGLLLLKVSVMSTYQI